MLMQMDLEPKHLEGMTGNTTPNPLRAHVWQRTAGLQAVYRLCPAMGFWGWRVAEG